MVIEPGGEGPAGPPPEARARAPHGPGLAKKAVALSEVSRSIGMALFSRHTFCNSSRSLVVSEPGGPCPASTSACRTQARSADS